jgi:hypothetical protein
MVVGGGWWAGGYVDKVGAIGRTREKGSAEKFELTPSNQISSVK